MSIRSPSDGVFYRRPSPEAPPYIDVGSPVSPGAVLGLVEVMKCFHQITYSDHGLPEHGTIAQIHVEDSAEVRFGQVLFSIRPAS